MSPEKLEELKSFIIKNEIKLEDVAIIFGFNNTLYQAVKIEQLIVHCTLLLENKDLHYNERCAIGKLFKSIKNLKEL